MADPWSRLAPSPSDETDQAIDSSSVLRYLLAL
jgi:hypothetical protein